jgi:hypothetical protein
MHRKLADSNNGMILDSPNNSDCWTAGQIVKSHTAKS